MHSQASALQVLQQHTETKADTKDTTSAVTSECGIQASSDTVCRGSQIAPVTRDAGCQYEECPTSTIATRPAFTPTIIKPSPIKHTTTSATTSPTRSERDAAMFVAAKALQQLQQNSAVLAADESVLQNQMKSIQGCQVTGPVKFRDDSDNRLVMHSQASALQVLQQHTAENNKADTKETTSAVTSECGIQASSDTVCRGSQIAPVTRDAGCQYEECPTSTIATRPAFTPTIIKPSPIKHTTTSATTSPTRSERDAAMFVAAKALQQLQQNSAVLAADESVLQNQMKSIQGCQVTGPVKFRDDSDNRLDGTRDTSGLSLLQPGLMGSLPLTSYALLLDALNTSTANLGQHPQLNSLVKSSDQFSGATPTITKPSLLSSGGMCSGNNLLSNSNRLTSLCTSPLFSGKTTSRTGGPFYRGVSTTTTPSSIPTMVKPTVTKDAMDIDSLMNSVIEEHMGGKKQDMLHHRGDQGGCHFSRQSSANGDPIGDYDQMTPPFKRRRRTVFTERQLQGLEEAYSKSQYLDRESRINGRLAAAGVKPWIVWVVGVRIVRRRHPPPSNKLPLTLPTLLTLLG
eukprot:sb/3463426/